jgi:putative transposase
MTNHVHLLMTPSTARGQSALMQNLGQRYVQYINRTYGRSGTLWEGRFRSCLVESARYVLACYRYIELNPVRAGLARRAEDYFWSSYRANAIGTDDRLAVPHPEFLALGIDEARRRRAYLGLFEEALETSVIRSIRDATNGGYPLASEAFRTGCPLPPGRKTVRGKPGRPRDKNKASGESTPEIGL